MDDSHRARHVMAILMLWSSGQACTPRGFNVAATQATSLANPRKTPTPASEPFFTLREEETGERNDGCRGLDKRRLGSALASTTLLPSSSAGEYQLAAMGAVGTFCLVVMENTQQVEVFWAQISGRELRLHRFDEIAAVPDRVRAAFGKGEGSESEGEFVVELEGRSARQLWADMMTGTRRCGLSATISARTSGSRAQDVSPDGKADFDPTPGRTWKLESAAFELNRPATGDVLTPRILDTRFAAAYLERSGETSPSTHCRVTRIFDEKKKSWRKWASLPRPRMSRLNSDRGDATPVKSNDNLMPPVLLGRSGEPKGVRGSEVGFMAVIAERASLNDCLNRIEKAGAVSLRPQPAGTVGARTTVLGSASEQVLALLAQESCIEEVVRSESIPGASSP